MQESPDPDGLLNSALTVVRRVLTVRGAAIEFTGPDGTVRRHGCGELGDRPADVPLRRHGSVVGRLLVSRAESGGLDPDQNSVLAVLTDHLAELVRAVGETAELRLTRHRMVTDREEERRRLRRSLHDGLAPTLAGMALSLDAARLTVQDDSARAEHAIGRLRDSMASAVGDIRDLVDGLRPPALDDLGLVTAIEAMAQESCDRADLRFHGDPAGLPAAVEVAAYQIVREALANVRRHARAGSVLVQLSRDDDLHIMVADSGVGLPEAPAAGTGLDAMRRHAAELGGTLTVTTRSIGGTIVDARLPLTATDAQVPETSGFRTE